MHRIRICDAGRDVKARKGRNHGHDIRRHEIGEGRRGKVGGKIATRHDWESDPFGLLFVSRSLPVELFMDGSREGILLCIEQLKQAGFSFLDGGYLYEIHVHHRVSPRFRFRVQLVVRVE